MTGLSIRGYAAHRGVSHEAVRKAIASGRITKEPDGSIDPEKADADWARNTNPARSKARSSAAAAALEAVNEALSSEADNSPSSYPSSEVTFQKVRVAGEMVKVQINKERLRRAKGEVVDRARAVSLVFDLARRERAAWQTWPARVAAEMAAELGVQIADMESVLDRHVRAHLAELAEVKVELR